MDRRVEMVCGVEVQSELRVLAVVELMVMGVEGGMVMVAEEEMGEELESLMGMEVQKTRRPLKPLWTRIQGYWAESRKSTDLQWSRCWRPLMACLPD